MRMEEKVGTTMLIDVLRGSSKGELIEHGYNKIKTYIDETGLKVKLPFLNSIGFC